MLERFFDGFVDVFKRRSLKAAFQRELDDALFRYSFGEHGREMSFEEEIKAITKNYRAKGLTEEDIQKVKKEMRLHLINPH